MNVKIDWTDEIKAFLSDNYEPIISLREANEQTEKMTIAKIKTILGAIYPAPYIYEEDIYDALLQLGFKSFLFTDTKVELDGEGEPTYTEVKGLAYFLQPKDSKVLSLKSAQDFL